MGRGGGNRGGASGRAQKGKRFIRRMNGTRIVRGPDGTERHILQAELTCGHRVDFPASHVGRKLFCYECDKKRADHA